MELSSPFNVPLHPKNLVQFIFNSIKPYGNRTAFMDSNTSWSCKFEDIPRCVDTVYGYFQKHGLNSGCRVALVSLNCPEVAFTQLAAYQLGIELIHANPLNAVEDLASSFKIAKCQVILTQPDFHAKLHEVCKKVPTCNQVLILPDQNSFLTSSNRTWSRDSIQMSPAQFLFFSSGTTGPPKCFQLPADSFTVNVEQMTSPQFAPSLVHGKNEENQERLLVVCSMMHVFAAMSNYYALANGHLLVTTPRFIPENLVDLLEKYKITYLQLVPPMVNFLANEASVENRDLSHLHSITSGSAPLLASVASRCKEKFRLKDMRQLYGMTEIRNATWTPYGQTNFASIGVLLPGMRAKFVDPETGKIANKPGVPGELWVSGPQIGGSYFENDEATKTIFISDQGRLWCRTGDMGYFDESGYVYLTDRCKDVFKYKGLQVSPAEIEELIHQHPDVIDCAVIGKPDELAGEIPAAFIVRRKGSSLNEEIVKSLVKGRLSSYKQLTGGVFFIDEIPRLPTGKMQKRRLRDMLKMMQTSKL